MPDARPTRANAEPLKDIRSGEIVRAARRALSRAGRVDPLLERIACAAGIAKGMLYLYFRGKDERNADGGVAFVASLQGSGLHRAAFRSCDTPRASRYLIRSMRSAIFARVENAMADAEAIVDFFVNGLGLRENA